MMMMIVIFQVNTKFVEMSKVQCLEAAVAADQKATKAAAVGALGPSSTPDHPFEGKAYVQVSYLLECQQMNHEVLWDIHVVQSSLCSILETSAFKNTQGKRLTCS